MMRAVKSLTASSEADGGDGLSLLDITMHMRQRLKHPKIHIFVYEVTESNLGNIVMHTYDIFLCLLWWV